VRSGALGGTRMAALQSRDKLHGGPGLKPLRQPVEGLAHGNAWRERNAAYDLVCGLCVGNPVVTIL